MTIRNAYLKITNRVAQEFTQLKPEVSILGSGETVNLPGTSGYKIMLPMRIGDFNIHSKFRFIVGNNENAFHLEITVIFQPIGSDWPSIVHDESLILIMVGEDGERLVSEHQPNGTYIVEGILGEKTLYTLEFELAS